MTTVHVIPDGPNPNDTITIEFGDWKGTLDGNDSIKASLVHVTVDGGAGNDTINAEAVRASIILGTGDDDVAVHRGEVTIGAGRGTDRISVTNAASAIRLGGGNDTVSIVGGTSTIVSGNGDDTVRVRFDGAHSIRLGGGNDTVVVHTANSTIVAGNGRDSVLAQSGAESIHLGSGNDTVDAFSASPTIVTGRGNDSIEAFNASHYSIHTGNGNDTVVAQFGVGDIHLGHGHNFVFLSLETSTVWTDPGSHDTIFASGSNVRIDDHGRDLINLPGGSGEITIGSGHDTIKTFAFDGTVTGHGNDSIKVIGSSADVNAGGAHDTITVGGAINLTLGHNDLAKFQDLSQFVASTHRHPIKEVLADATGGHDTFVYQYNDDMAAAAGDANSVGIGTDIITNFSKKTDVLAFDDTGSLLFFTQADLQHAATVIDHVGGHSITIVVHTSHGAAAGSIVLKGIGTIHHHLASINDLVNHGYHLQFS
jgi:Ca2+-binding RTX toxin-like protein